MDKLEQIEQIEKYLTNEMSTDERAMFEAQLKTDKTLQEELAAYKLIHENIEDWGDEHLLGKLDQAHNSFLFKERLWRMGKWIGLIILAFSALMLLRLFESKESQQKENTPITDTTATVQKDTTQATAPIIIEDTSDSKTPIVFEEAPEQIKDEQVHSFEVPLVIGSSQELKYTLTNEALTLYNLPPDQRNLLAIRAYKDQLYLKIDDKYYQLKTTNQQLKREQDIRILDRLKVLKPSKKKLKVRFTGLINSHPSEHLTAEFRKSSESHFKLYKQGEQYTIAFENFDVSTLPYLVQHNQTHFLVLPEQIYQLDADSNFILVEGPDFNDLRSVFFNTYTELPIMTHDFERYESNNVQ